MSSQVKHYPLISGGAKQRYASAVVIDNLVFVSGMTAQDPATGTCQTHGIRDQFNVCLARAKNALEEVGSSMENIVKTLIIVKDMKDFPELRAVEAEFYKKHAPRLIEEPPACTAMQIVALAKPEFLVEYEATAILKRK
jgi:2-iminobutanoate/2-iminopropanoate deaminase